MSDRIFTEDQLKVHGELILAWLNGAKIESRGLNYWVLVHYPDFFLNREYRIAKPKENKWIPFTMETFLPYKYRWFRYKNCKTLSNAREINSEGILASSFIGWEDFLSRFTFEDGSPCGVEVEE